MVSKNVLLEGLNRSHGASTPPLVKMWIKTYRPLVCMKTPSLSMHHLQERGPPRGGRYLFPCSPEINWLKLSSWCLVMVERLFLAVPQGCLRFVIVVFPDHTHYFCSPVPQTSKICFLMFPVPQYCLCSPVPLKTWPLFPCSPEINAFFPLFPKTPGRASRKYKPRNKKETKQREGLDSK